MKADVLNWLSLVKPQNNGAVKTPIKRNIRDMPMSRNWYAWLTSKPECSFINEGLNKANALQIKTRLPYQMKILLQGKHFKTNRKTGKDE